MGPNYVKRIVDMDFPPPKDSRNLSLEDEENRTGGRGFTSGVSLKKTNMLGEQIRAGQLTNHERTNDVA